MILERAKRLLQVQAGYRGFYTANSAKLILSEANHEQGRPAVDGLILELELEKIFGSKPGTRF